MAIEWVKKELEETNNHGLSGANFKDETMGSEKQYYVYIMTNWNHKVMYIGMTNDLIRRIYEHKSKLVEGFTRKYNVEKLVYFESTQDVIEAISREKQLKKWRREKKDDLVASLNPEWRDLSSEWLKIPPASG